MACVIQPLPDVETTGSGMFQSDLPVLVSPFTFQLLDDKPQDPIYERLSSARQQLESLELDAPLRPVFDELPSSDTSVDKEDSYPGDLWLDTVSSRRDPPLQASPCSNV